MCKGVGIDLCRISRFEDEQQREKFMLRYYAPEEQEYIRQKGRGQAQSCAGIYAAKEAVLKAMGTGITCALQEVVILHHPAGQPYVQLIGEAAAQAPGGTWQLSITHEGDMAAAIAVWSE